MLQSSRQVDERKNFSLTPGRAQLMNQFQSAQCNSCINEKNKDVPRRKNRKLILVSTDAFVDFHDYTHLSA